MGNRTHSGSAEGKGLITLCHQQATRQHISFNEKLVFRSLFFQQKSYNNIIYKSKLKIFVMLKDPSTILYYYRRNGVRLRSQCDTATNELQNNTYYIQLISNETSFLLGFEYIGFRIIRRGQQEFRSIAASRSSKNVSSFF